MKRFLIVLLAAVVAGGAFAQDLKLNVDMRSGVGLYATDVEDSDPGVMVWSPTGGYGIRADLKGAYTNANGNAGFNFILRSSRTNNETTPISTWMENARVWLKFIDNKVTFYGGKTDDGGLGLGLGIDSSLDVGAGVGLFTQIDAIDNLRVGVGFYPGTTFGVLGAKKLDAANYRFGFTYALPDLAKFGAIYAKDGYTLSAIGGVNILALSSLGLTTLGVDFGMWDIDNKITQQLRIGEKIVFAQGDLEAGARFIQAITTGDAKDASTYAPDLTFYAYAQYKLNDATIVPRIDIGYNMGTNRYTTTAGKAADMINYIPATVTTYNTAALRANGIDIVTRYKNTKDASQFAINPSVGFWIASNQLFQIGYGAYVNMTKDIKDSVYGRSIEHLVYLDYRVNL